MSLPDATWPHDQGGEPGQHIWETAQKSSLIRHHSQLNEYTGEAGQLVWVTA